MKATSKFNRRRLIAGMAAMQLDVQASPHVFGADSIYTRMFGLRPLLCGRGHTTVYGGSLMPAEVMRAMVEANDYFIDLNELNEAAGRRIAEVMQAEAAMVTAGAFSAMVLGAAACLTGTEKAAKKDRTVMAPHEFVELGKKSGVPVLIDAAAEIPPPETLTRFTK